MEFRILSQKEAFTHYKSLYKKVKKSYTSFNGLDFFNLRLFKGDFLLLKNRFDSQVFAFFSNNRPRVLMTHYRAIDNKLGVPNSLGAILVDSHLTKEEILFFDNHLQLILKNLSSKVLFPLNGHLNLGFSLPSVGTNSENITFLTSADNVNVQSLLSSIEGVRIERKFFSMSFSVDSNPEYLTKIKNSINDRPVGYSVEKLSLFNYKRDIRDYNFILNESFKDHYAFFPLSFEEEWDLMKTAILVINRNYFRFLSHHGKRIAVSMFLPDYNTVLKNGEDLKNMARIFFSQSSLKRVRGVNVAILPEYRGKGLIKYVRNENILKMIDDGVTIIESSYIDQDNINSKENVKSTGAIPAHYFELFSLF